MKKKAHKRVHHKVERHFDTETFLLLLVVVLSLLVYYAMQNNLPLASFLKLR